MSLVNPFTVNFTVADPDDFAEGVFENFVCLHEHIAKELDLDAEKQTIMRDTARDDAGKMQVIASCLASLIDSVCDDEPQAKIALIKRVSMLCLDSDETNVVSITPENIDEFFTAVKAAEDAGETTVTWGGQAMPIEVARQIIPLAEKAREAELASVTKH